MMRATILKLALLAAALPAGAMAAPGYQSIELRGGGLVTVRYGQTRQYDVRGDRTGRAITADGDRLVIDRCRQNCRHGQRLEVVVTTPAIGRLAVRDGGLIQVRGDFPAQPSVSASVDSGGQIDMRPLAAGQVSAAVSQGGRIFARPLRAMNAAIADGGLVTYWGEAAITSSVRRGGAVVKGAARELGQPLEAFDPTVQNPPALLPVPPIPPLPAPSGSAQ